MLDKFPLVASLAASDIERAKRWYQEKLGLAPAVDLGVEGNLYVTGGSSFIVYRTEFAGTAKNTVAGWAVDDLDAVMTYLRGRGVRFEEYSMGDKGPNTVNGVSVDPAGGRGAWFKDSEGNILSITQLPPGMALPGAQG